MCFGAIDDLKFLVRISSATFIQIIHLVTLPHRIGSVLVAAASAAAECRGRSPTQFQITNDLPYY